MWNRYTLVTRVAPDQCYRRLRNRTCHWLDLVPELPLKGGVSPTGFHVTRTYPHYPLASGIVAYGQFTPISDGTRITIRFGLHWFPNLPILVLGALGFVSWVSSFSRHGPLFPQLVVPLLFYGFWFCLGALLLWLSTWDKAYLLCTIEETLSAERSAGS